MIFISIKSYCMAGLAVFIALFLHPPGPVSAGDLTWTGCGITKKAFMGEIARAYRDKYGKTIAITGGGATQGIRSASSGEFDLGGTCRHWIYDPRGEIIDLEKNAELVHVAWDALVVIVHPDNPIESISMENLKKVYNGEITSWQDLGGRDMPIALITRTEPDSGVGHMFRRLVFGDPGYTFKARSIKVSSTAPLEKMVEKTVIAMGMDGVGSARKSKVKILAIDGIHPSKENISEGRYPLYRPLYIAFNKNAGSEVKNVIHFIMGEEGQAIISAQGTVNRREGLKLEPLWQAKKSLTGMDCLE